MQYEGIDTEGGKWLETNDNENSIAPGLVERIELVVDDWEVRNVSNEIILVFSKLFSLSITDIVNIFHFVS